MNFAEATRALHSNGVDSQGGASRFDPAVLWSVLVATSSCGFSADRRPLSFRTSHFVARTERGFEAAHPEISGSAAGCSPAHLQNAFLETLPLAPDAARTVADGVTIFFLTHSGSDTSAQAVPAAAIGDSSRYVAATPSISSTEFSSGQSIHWALLRVSMGESQPRAGTAEPAAQHRLALASTSGGPDCAPPSSRNTEDVSTRVDDRTSRVRPKAGLRDNGTKRLQHQRRGLIQRIELPGSPSMLTEEMH